MKLYLISSGYHDYDTYDSAVVAAPSAKAARSIHPDGDERSIDNRGTFCFTWPCNQADVTVEYLGEAKKGTKRGVICASFQAG